MEALRFCKIGYLKVKVCMSPDPPDPGDDDPPNPRPVIK
jgi:hypothetical protein